LVTIPGLYSVNPSGYPNWGVLLFYSVSPDKFWANTW